jgi:hypothetical protein
MNYFVHTLMSGLPPPPALRPSPPLPLRSPSRWRMGADTPWPRGRYFYFFLMTYPEIRPRVRRYNYILTLLQISQMVVVRPRGAGDTPAGPPRKPYRLPGGGRGEPGVRVQGIVVTVKSMYYAADGTGYSCNVVRTNSVLGLVRAPRGPARDGRLSARAPRAVDVHLILPALRSLWDQGVSAPVHAQA